MGPWFVALIYEQKTQKSELFVHTHPFLVAHAQKGSAKENESWIPYFIVGPFVYLDNSLKFLQTWDKHKKFQTRRDNIYNIFKTVTVETVNIWKVTLDEVIPQQQYNCNFDTSSITLGEMKEGQNKRKIILK